MIFRYLKILLIFLLINSINTFSYCQDLYDPLFSEKLTVSSSVIEFNGIFAQDTTGFYAIKKDHLYTLEHYNNKLEKTGEERILINTGLQSYSFIKALMFHDSLYVFYSVHRFSTISVFVRTINKETLLLNEDEREIYKMPYYKANYPEVFIQLSQEHEKLLIALETASIWNKSIKFDILVFDEEMNLAWNRIDYLEYNGRMPWNTSYVVDENANVFILKHTFTAAWLALTNDRIKDQYLVISYNDKGQSLKNHSFNLENKFARDIKIIAGTNNSFVCAGFFSNNYKFGIEGAFYVSNNTSTKEIKPPVLHKFSYSIMQNQSLKDAIGEGNELYSFSLNHVVLRNNGSVVIAGQQEFDQDYNNMNTILLTSFTMDGEVAWENLIEKKQSGKDYTSYALIAPSDKDEFVILYNESSLNNINDWSLTKKSYWFPKESYLVVAHVNDIGVITKTMTLERRKKEVVPVPLKTYDCRNGDVVLLARKYYKYKFIKLSLI